MNYDDDDAPGMAREAACRLLAYLGWRCSRTDTKAVEPDFDGFTLNDSSDEGALEALMARLREQPERREAFGVRWDDAGQLVSDRDEPERGFLDAWNRRAAAAETAEDGDELEAVWRGPWTEHPRVPVEDWRHEVANDDTRQGYWSYAASELFWRAQEKDDGD